MRSPEFVPVYRSGECDSCHCDEVLYEFEDDEEGGWRYCLHCADRIKRNRIKKIRAWEAETGQRYSW